MVIHEEEVFLGYPDHIKRVIGQMGEASRECLFLFPELSAKIRDYRLKVMDAPTFFPPYMTMLNYVDLLVECERQGVPMPGLPEALTEKHEVKKTN
jgi:hypothetical protein